jgi:hypothetical protein
MTDFTDSSGPIGPIKWAVTEQRVIDLNTPGYLTLDELDALASEVAVALGVPEDDVTADMVFAFARQTGRTHSAE